MRSHGKSLATAALLILGGLNLSGCATTEYEDEQIALVNGRISTVEAKVQEDDATAQGAANDARTANQRIDQLTGRVDSLEQRLAQRAPRN